MLSFEGLKESADDVAANNWMLDACNELLNSWLLNLTKEEKEIWLWNATVEMKRIQRRRQR